MPNGHVANGLNFAQRQALQRRQQAEKEKESHAIELAAQARAKMARERADRVLLLERRDKERAHLAAKDKQRGV